MLDRLPAELLDEILDLAAPVLDWPAGSRERRETLRRCCLVCKAVKARAQPLLWRDVDFSPPARVRDLDKAVSCKPELAELVKTFKDKFAVSALPRLVNLVRLSLVGTVSLVDLHAFSSFPDLADLHLQGVSLSRLAQERPLHFPSIRQLALLNVTFRTLEEMEILLDASILPELRALSIAGLSDGTTSRRVLPSLPPRLRDRLDVLEVYTSDVSLLDERVLARPAVLVLGNIQNRSFTWLDHASQAEHIRLPPLNRLPEVAEGQDLSLDDIHNVIYLKRITADLHTLLASKPASRLRCLYVPTVPFSSAVSEDDTSALEEVRAFKRMLKACEAKGIEVVELKEEKALEYSVRRFYPISREVWRRMKQLKQEG
ncbi:hypothetical protein JCM10213_007806 [Rhodosporidiobolus nylandii]